VAVLIAYPFYEGRHVNAENTTLTIDGLPSALKNIRIVYATDILESARYPQSSVDSLVNTINGLSADLVLFGGNYAENSDATVSFFEHLPGIHARLGVYGVLGDCDRAGPDSDITPLIKSMENAGITPLVNSVAKVKIGQTALFLAGSDDKLNGQPDLTGLASQVRENDFVIFMGNNPDLLADALKATGSDGDNHWFDLALFGHTLGGQFTFVGLPLKASLVPAAGNRYLSGWLVESRANILISNGVGTRDFPARILAPAKIHLITLKNQ